MKDEKDIVSHVAALARLRFEEEELDELRGQLGQILAFVDQLNELELSCDLSEGTVHGLYNVFREDGKGDSMDRDAILANASEQQDGCYVVPRIID